ncbi:hypothetical protein CA13_67490 [Planctomycetes bacterium CA13]|uniref:Uncharacterized protein n=1 Tax=Novipirellula herctigrandis TaxID=2527986 RepID=A0A5C5YN57_9BACT|nr:hypothetical protein CA13_67490 [Planctomycetes bacterium CA13]
MLQTSFSDSWLIVATGVRSASDREAVEWGNGGNCSDLRFSHAAMDTSHVLCWKVHVLGSTARISGPSLKSPRCISKHVFPPMTRQIGSVDWKNRIGMESFCSLGYRRIPNAVGSRPTRGSPSHYATFHPVFHLTQSHHFRQNTVLMVFKLVPQWRQSGLLRKVCWQLCAGDLRVELDRRPVRAGKSRPGDGDREPSSAFRPTFPD